MITEDDVFLDLLSDMCGLADDVAHRITDATVDMRLNQLLEKLGFSGQPGSETEPAIVLDSMSRLEILATAQRALALRTAADENLPAA